MGERGEGREREGERVRWGESREWGRGGREGRVRGGRGEGDCVLKGVSSHQREQSPPLVT